MGNGWGNWGGNAGMNGGVPYIVNNDVQRGFDQQALISGINGINSAIGDLAQAQCAGQAGLTAAINNGFANAESAAAARALSNLQAMNAIAMTQQQNGCENRAAVADLKYTVATEACADRAAVSNALNSALSTFNAGIQSLKDQMCQDKIDAKNERIADLERQLNMAQLAATQNDQTAAIQAGQRALANEIEQYVLPTPRPAWIVQNPNCCAQNYGCGCNMA